MRRSVAEDAEIVRRSNDAAAEQMMPYAVDQDARQKRIDRRIDHLSRQLQPSTAMPCRRRSRAGERFQESTRHGWAAGLVRSANEHILILWAAVHHRHAQTRLLLDAIRNLALLLKKGAGLIEGGRGRLK